MWRVLTHQHAPTRSLRELEEWWSLDDLMSAHIALDVIDDIEQQSAERARREED